LNVGLLIIWYLWDWIILNILLMILGVYISNIICLRIGSYLLIVLALLKYIITSNQCTMNIIMVILMLIVFIIIIIPIINITGTKITFFNIGIAIILNNALISLMLYFLYLNFTQIFTWTTLMILFPFCKIIFLFFIILHRIYFY